jgi:hypothetical protein
MSANRNPGLAPHLRAQKLMAAAVKAMLLKTLASTAKRRLIIATSLKAYDNGRHS